MNWKLIDRAVAAAVFVYALVLYVLTVAPTTSFWDSGEFIAIAHGLQVSHPPGAPFYMLVGRFFSMFVPSAYIALAVNLVSVLASAVTVLLTHLIIVRLVRAWQGDPAGWSTVDRLSALVGGVVGACTFAVTDSFWFNAVEAEVYAMSMFFTAAVVWLILKWREQAQQEEEALAGSHHPFGLASNRYLVLIAYLFGLAIGVHLLNLLAIFFIALIFFFDEFERPDWTRGQLWTGIFVTGLISAAAFLFVYPGVIQMLPGIIGASGAPLLFTVALIGLVVFGVYYTHQKHMPVANLVMLCVSVVLIGYSTYALIFIRSAADPPIDENDPETVEAIVSYLKREQYGQTPLLKGASYDNALGRVDQANEKLFPRRFSPDPMHWRVYDRYSSDSEFFWEYQVGHMYVRYFLWNFAGRAADTQDAPAITGVLASEDGTTLEQSPSEAAGRNVYYGLPLLLGLVGAAYHFMRDWRRAFSVLVLFLVTGLGIIVYLNQTPIQPRERDYSYVASFFAFALWVGIGATGILQLVSESVERKLSVAGRNGVALLLGGVLFAAVPLLMLVQNYDDHDRSGNYVAREYAYNMLMSVEENGILFTNGDNDTFPLWYLQEVEDVRTDVRVVNLSLLNTPWYVRQLKHQWSHESEPLPISLSDEQIDDLTVIRWEPTEVQLPVDEEALLRNTEVNVIQPRDTSQIESPMTWTLRGRPYTQEISILYAADQVAFDILRTNAAQGWKRPIYFAVTVSHDGQLDLQNYFQMEGQAFRVVPIRHEEPLGRVVPEVALARLDAFRFTNLNDPDVYYDENIRRMVDNYRNIYTHIGQELADQGRPEAAREVLEELLEAVPFETIPGDVRSLLLLAGAFQQVGAEERVVELTKKVEPLVLADLTNPRSTRDAELAAQYAQYVQLTYLKAGAYEDASAFSGRLAAAVGNDSLRQSASELQRLYRQLLESTPPDVNQ